MNKTNVTLPLLVFSLISATTLAETSEVKSNTNREPASYTPTYQPSTAPGPSTAETVTNSDNVPDGKGEDFGLTGNWGGLRSSLSEKGVNFAAIYKTETSRVFSGGEKRTSSYLQNLDLRLLVDADKLLGLKGTKFYVSGLGNWGRAGKPSETVGDAQGVSNIEAPVNLFRLYEAWVEQNFFDDKVSLLVGIHDLNSEFYVTDTSGLFLNSSLGVGRDLSQTGKMGPSVFPYTTGAVRLRVNPSEHYYVQAAAFNAVAGNPDNLKDTHYAFKSSDGYLYIAEAAYVGSESSPCKYALGAWTYSEKFDHLTDTVNGGTEPKQVPSSGMYFLVDQSLTDSLSAFARYGAASTASNPIKSNASVGFVVKGPLYTRPDDSIGLSVTQVRATEEQESDTETTYELSYRVNFGHGIALQPDLQYVRHPNFSTETKDSFVGLIRLEVGL